MTEQRERVINAPWSVLTLIIVLLGGFAVQTYWVGDATVLHWAFRPADLAQGRYATLITATFLHGSWAHVMGNAAFALAFATPVARRMGNDALGVAAFYVFYLVCGALANLGYAVLNPHNAAPVLGASGAIAGMMGAASRLMTQDPDELAPLNSQPVVMMAIGWIVVNVVFGVFLGGLAPGVGSGSIAWQVHLAGYAAGLLLLAPLLAIIGRLKVDHGIEN